MATQLSYKAQMYHSLYKVMMSHHYEMKHDEAQQMAENLLFNDDLPLIIRVRCHMLLCATTEYPKIAVEHGRLAVQLLDKDVREIYAVEDSSSKPFPQKFLDESRELLDFALKDLEEESVGSEHEGGDKDGDAGTEGEKAEKAKKGKKSRRRPGLSAADALAIEEAVQYTASMKKGGS